MTSPVARRVSMVCRISCSIFHSTSPVKNSTRGFTTPALTQMRGEFQALLSAEPNSFVNRTVRFGVGHMERERASRALEGGGVERAGVSLI